MCVGRYVHVSAGAPQGSRKDIRYCGAGVTASCEQFNMGAGDQTQVLGKNNTHSLFLVLYFRTGDRTQDLA